MIRHRVRQHEATKQASVGAICEWASDLLTAGPAPPPSRACSQCGRRWAQTGLAAGRLCRSCEREAHGQQCTREREAEAVARQQARDAGLVRAPVLLPKGTVRYTRVVDGVEFDVVWCG